MENVAYRRPLSGVGVGVAVRVIVGVATCLRFHALFGLTAKASGQGTSLLSSGADPDSRLATAKLISSGTTCGELLGEAVPAKPPALVNVE